MKFEIVMVLATIAFASAKPGETLKCYVCEDCPKPTTEPQECTRDGLSNVGPGLMNKTQITYIKDKSFGDPLFDCQKVEAIDRTSGKVIVARRCQLKLEGNAPCEIFRQNIINGVEYKNATCNLCFTDACNHSGEIPKIWSTLIVSTLIFSCLFMILS